MNENVLRPVYRDLTEEEKLQVKELKELGLKLYKLVNAIGENRELKIALTKIEEASMWAMKGIIQ